jgi:hypothetical protein
MRARSRVVVKKSLAMLVSRSPVSSPVRDYHDQVNNQEVTSVSGLEFPNTFAYSRFPPLHKKHVYRIPLILISRLFLMHLVSTLSPSNLNALANKIGEIQMPSHVPRLFGPKVVARPRDLSPGEYETFMHAGMPLLALDKSIGLDEAGIGRWLHLYVAQEKLWNA